jgi:hypothetical protein
MRRADPTSTRTGLWFAFLAGPLAWTAHELISYALVRPACSANALIVEYLVSLAALALAGSGILVAGRSHGWRARVPRSTAEFVLAAAILLDLVFGFAIVLEAIPEAVISPCL